MTKTTTLDWKAIDWKAIGEFLEACGREALKFLDRCDDLGWAFLFAVLLPKAKAEELAEQLCPNERLRVLGLEAGWRAKPYVEKVVLAWLIGQIEQLRKKR